LFLGEEIVFADVFQQKKKRKVCDRIFVKALEGTVGFWGLSGFTFRDSCHFCCVPGLCLCTACFAVYSLSHGVALHNVIITFLHNLLLLLVLLLHPFNAFFPGQPG